MSSPSNNHIETIELYLLNQLNEDERNAFEISMLNDPKLFEEVQRQEAFIAALKNQKASLRTKSSTSNRQTFLQWIAQPYSIASALALAVSIIALPGALLIGTDSTQEMARISHVASSLTLEPLRGSEDKFAASGQAPVLVSIDIGPTALTDTKIYNVSLVNQATSQTTFIDEAVNTDSQGFLKIILNQDLTGEYRVDVFEFDSSERVASYLVDFES